MTETPLTAEQRELAARYFPWARRMAKTFGKRYGRRIEDEIESNAVLALIGVARRFEPARGLSFKTLAQTRIRGAMCDTYRVSRHKVNQAEPLHEAIFDEPEDYDIDETPTHQIDVDDLLAIVTPDERAILRLWSWGLSFKAIGRQLGRPATTVCQHCRQAIRTIQAHVNTEKV